MSPNPASLFLLLPGLDTGRALGGEPGQCQPATPRRGRGQAGGGLESAGQLAQHFWFTKDWDRGGEQTEVPAEDSSRVISTAAGCHRGEGRARVSTVRPLSPSCSPNATGEPAGGLLTAGLIFTVVQQHKGNKNMPSADKS
eukprot:bmy_02943T0